MVSDAWSTLRDLLETIDQNIIPETDYALLHLFYEEPIMANSVLWLLGEYIDYIETEVVLMGRKVSGSGLISNLRARRFSCALQAMPDIGFIPGLHT